MSWQGIPFPIGNDIINYALNVNKLPVIAVQTSSGVAWETIVGAMIAAAIPAAIAWWSIKRNIETLETDRQKQQESFDADRDAQLDIASKNLNAQVLSSNRQQWINTLREAIADYLGAVHALRRSRTIARWCWDSSKKNGTEFHIEHHEAVKRLMDDSKTVDTLAYKIKLLVNPLEPDADGIIRILNEVPKHTGDFKKKANRDELLRLSDELTKSAQSYLKKEWSRVKNMQ
ncbi:hypothetical protein [Serratia fonticola]